MSDNDRKQCHILISQYPLLRVCGHNLLVLVDEAGTVIAELDGLATSKKGAIKPIGYLPSDRLKAYQFTGPYLYRHQQPKAVLYSGCRVQVEKRWQAAVRGKEAINDLALAYPFLGLGRNSNSVTSTLIACMGLEAVPMPGARPAPGQRQRVLPREMIAVIRNEMAAGANTGLRLDID
jgi:hypothetical protein